MSLIKEANEKFRRKDYVQALKLYEKIGAKSPEMKRLVHVNIELTRKRIDSSKGRPVLIASDKARVINIGSSALYEGKLERVESSSFKGWAVSKKDLDENVELEVFLDGTLFVKERSAGSRKDLKRHGKSNGLGGFSFSIPEVLLDQPMHQVELRFPDGKALAKTEISGCRKAGNLIPSWVPVNESVSVIVPIYNALDDVKVCIERLIKYTENDVDVILINDASSDPDVTRFLESVALPENYHVFHNEKNLGFTKTINRGMKLANDNDVVLLNSDARVTPRWLVGLRRALARDSRIATVTPMSDRAGAFSAPNIGNANDLPEFVSEEAYAIAFRRRSYGHYPVVPTGNGFCLYIRRACIDDIGALDEEAFPKGYGEENDFCMRARKNGWFNVIDDRTYVFHDRNKSFGEQKSGLISRGRAIVDMRYPDYKKAIRTFSESNLIAAARFGAKKALADVIEAEGFVKPRVLYVVSTLTGGTPQTNRDLMLSLSDRVEPWLLHCDSRFISLYQVFKHKPDELVSRIRLSEEVEPLTHVSSEYDRVLTGLLNDYDFSLVHIRHLAWHSLNFPRLARESGAKVVKSFHDFYAICPTVKLLDENNVFCEGKCTNTSGDCTIDLWEDKTIMPRLKDQWVHSWRSMFKDKVLAYSDAFITTHESVKNSYMEVFGDINNFHVIPHGRDFEHFSCVAEPYDGKSKLRVLVPGNVSAAKGGDIIHEVAKNNDNIEFHILGKSSRPGRGNVVVYGEYQRDEFLNKVNDIRPHVGMVMSIWNETWCHTLTEMWAAGIPVVVSEYATLSDRVSKTSGGWVVPAEVRSVTDILNKLSMSPFEIGEKISSVVEWQEGLGVEKSVASMGDDYMKVYNILFDG